MTGFKVFAIYHDGEDLWFNVKEEDWNDDFNGECAFPTEETAREYIIKQSIPGAGVCCVEIPQKEQTYEYYQA